MLGGMTLMTMLITRSTTTAIDGLRGEMNARFDAVHTEMNARFDAVNAEINARFDTVNAKIEHLDRDVTMIGRCTWGEPTAE